MIAVLVGGDLRFLAVASPSYLRGKPMPETPDQLALRLQRVNLHHDVPFSTELVRIS